MEGRKDGSAAGPFTKEKWEDDAGDAGDAGEEILEREGQHGE